MEEITRNEEEKDNREDIRQAEVEKFKGYYKLIKREGAEQLLE